MLRRLAHIKRRRNDLSKQVNIDSEFEAWEETCVPSYCHPNVLAAYVSWARLFTAVDMARHFAKDGPILDFGASVGEVGHLTDGLGEYHFIEQDDLPASFLARSLPAAQRHTLETAPTNAFESVFALDSLEHNDNYAELLDVLHTKLTPSGVLIISGPTENRVYRLGRRIAGFKGEYHVTNIAMIEDAASKILRLRSRKTVPFGLPLFRISAWMK